MADTIPTGTPRSSSTGPCSMWTSRYPRGRPAVHRSSSMRSGSPPKRRIASRIEIPSASVRSRSVASNVPAAAALPRYVDPKRNPSSSANASTSSANGIRRLASCRRCTAARATITPSGPSYLPASGTLSRREPSRRVGLPASEPSKRARRLPTLSWRTVMPAARIHSATCPLARRIDSDAYGLVSLPASSLSVPRMSSRSMAVPAGERSGVVAFHEGDVLRALPQDLPAEHGELIVAFDDRGEVVAGELARPAGESRRAVRKQDLGFAEPTRVKKELAGRRVARVVLVADVEGEVAEGDPARFSAPACLDQLRREREHGAELRAAPGRTFALEPGRESQVADCDPDHSVFEGFR